MKQLTTLLIITLTALFAGAYNQDENTGMMWFREKAYEHALAPLQRAAKAGSLPALDALGQMYQNGWGVKADKTIMMNMYNKAILKNYAPAMYHLGCYYYKAGDQDKGLELANKASELGHTEASLELGNLYFHHYSDPEKALKYFNQALANGDNMALNGIAKYYIALEDYANAASTLNEARRKRVITNEMKMRLANIYYEGKGVAKDLDMVLELLTELEKDHYQSNISYNEVYEEANKVTAPVYPGGYEALYSFLRKNARKPTAAIPSALNGTATVEFTITPTGEVTGHDYVRRCFFKVDEEVLRLSKMLRGWTPATRGGKKCSTVARLSMSFYPAYKAEIKFVRVK